jgi:hypothetical protein
MVSSTIAGAEHGLTLSWALAAGVGLKCGAIIASALLIVAGCSTIDASSCGTNATRRISWACCTCLLADLCCGVYGMTSNQDGSSRHRKPTGNGARHKTAKTLPTIATVIAVFLRLHTIVPMLVTSKYCHADSRRVVSSRIVNDASSAATI